MYDTTKVLLQLVEDMVVEFNKEYKELVYILESYTHEDLPGRVSIAVEQNYSSRLDSFEESILKFINYENFDFENDPTLINDINVAKNQLKHIVDLRKICKI